MKNIMISMFLIFVSFFFISCGGEGPDDPVDTDHVVVDDNEPVDNDVEPVDDTTDSEPTDDLTEETPDDDGLVDEELTDDDSTPLTCDQDETCKEICKNFLNLQGTWNNIDPEDVGSVEITLAVKDVKCEIKMVGQWTATWYGLDFPLDPFLDGINFFLVKNGANIVVKAKEPSDNHLIDEHEYSR